MQQYTFQNKVYLFYNPNGVPAQSQTFTEKEVIALIVRIGVTSGWEPGTVVEGWPMVYVNKGLTDSLEEAGAIPIIIPIFDNTQHITSYMDFIDAIIIAGEILSVKRNVVKAIGTNVLENSNPLRYKNEMAAIQAAIRHKKPLLGICRGFQVLTVVEGGSVGDNDINIGNHVLHQQGGVYPPDVGSHRIHITPESKLFDMLKVHSPVVNSFHRQAVDKMPDGYRVAARSEDHHIEAIESISGPFRMGLQFHPEMLTEKIWKDFFVEFVNLVRTEKLNS
jgi:putative glutamine amidotransferase